MKTFAKEQNFGFKCRFESIKNAVGESNGTVFDVNALFQKYVEDIYSLMWLILFIYGVTYAILNKFVTSLDFFTSQLG